MPVSAARPMTERGHGAGGRGLRIAVLSIFAAGLIAVFALGGHHYLSLETIHANRTLLQHYVAENYALALVGATLLYMLTTSFGISAIFLTCSMGFLFGRWTGALAVIVAASIGATLVFLGARYLFADTAIRLIGKRGEKIAAGFRENAFSYLLFLRVVPLFPFWLVNIVPAIAEVPTRTFVTATVIGIMPGSFILANLGQSLAEIKSARQLLSTQNIVAFGLLGMLALTPVAIKKIRGTRARRVKTL